MQFHMKKYFFTILVLLIFVACQNDDGSSTNNNPDPAVNGTVTDINGNVYNTIKIGTQTWMAENLKVTNYRNGDLLPQGYSAGTWSSGQGWEYLNNKLIGACCSYDESTSNLTTYGLLYNWYAVSDPRGLAPVGWHIPTKEEWITLSEYLGGDNLAGGQLKATTLWASPNTGASNSSGFRALPGGGRSNHQRPGHAVGEFGGLLLVGQWWTSTDFDEINSEAVLLYYNDNIFRISSTGDKGGGLSIRCVKD
jgi:uncharacterized protein (TIGR02145 family)